MRNNRCRGRRGDAFRRNTVRHRFEHRHPEALVERGKREDPCAEVQILKLRCGNVAENVDVCSPGALFDGAQFLIATHSPILMAYPNATIFQMSEDGPFEIPYRETEHYAVTKRFLNQPEEMLEVLLNPDLYGD